LNELLKFVDSACLKLTDIEGLNFVTDVQEVHKITNK
jgi:hypothetical protein